MPNRTDLKALLRRARAHVHALWPRHPLLPVAPFALFAVYVAMRGELRVDHVLLVVIAAVLAYVGPRTKELLLGLYPLGLVAVLYDAMRPFEGVGLTPSRVHVCDLHALDARLFGVTVSGQRVAVHDWIQMHRTLALDLACAVPYATFLLVCVACAVWLHVKDRPAMRRFGWGFLLLNVAGFATYHLVPAAPPWYFHAHGCAVNLGTKATEGPALARVDATLGVPFFHAMYARASSVFGAMPSLHCAYPLLVVIEGWRSFKPWMRVGSVAFWLAMVFSAVYLDHHWVIDAIVGSAYAVMVTALVRATFALLARRGAAPEMDLTPSVREPEVAE